MNNPVATVALSRNGRVVDFALPIDLNNQRVGLCLALLAPNILRDGNLGERASIAEILWAARTPACSVWIFGGSGPLYRRTVSICSV